MPMKTLVKNCPHCGKVCEQRAYMARGREGTDEDRWLFGTPLKLCPNCRELYIDRDMQEMAITPPRKRDTALVGASTLKIAGLGAILGTAMHLGKLHTLGWITWGVALATLAADLALYPTRMGKLKREKQASEQRLSDPKYALALKRAGYDVPERYLQEGQEEQSNDL